MTRWAFWQNAERELSLYGVTKWLDSSALLRWGDSLAEFSWSFGGPLIVEPQLWCWDVDSDGQEEVVVINHVGSGTGTSIEELHVVKKDGDGTLTDYCFPESLWQEDLSGLLSVVSDGGQTYTVLGADLVDLTDEIQTQFPDLNPAHDRGRLYRKMGQFFRAIRYGWGRQRSFLYGFCDVGGEGNPL